VSSTHTEHDHHHGGPGHSHSHDEGGHRHGSALAQPEVPISEGAASAAVAIDIGNGLGALVILPGERFRGREIEISRVDSDEPRTHTGVHERSKKGGKVLTAIFGSLPAGEYVIWEDALTAGPVVEIPDGAVAQVKLP
jgi:hypothetical protein